MIPNEVLSPEMKVDPIPEGTTVEFQLISQATPDERGITRLKPAASLVGESSIFDPYKQQPVNIGNVTSSREVISEDGRARKMQRTSRVEFISGSIRLGVRDYNTYQFLMRRDDNASNPFADPSVPKRYKLVSSVALSQDLLEKDMLFDMIKTAIRQADREQVNKLFAKMYPKSRINTSPEQKTHIISTLKRELKDYLAVVKKMPEDFPNKSEIDAVSAVFEAIDRDIITHDTQNRLWRWKDGVRYPGIVDYPPGDDAIMKLIKHFRNKQNKKLYDGLLDILSGKKQLETFLLEINTQG